ncbi:hypothetical protein BGZ93_005617 [Podila epicladia]|nr:hypothetical protein BGZ92_006570 [Podila epicladia]KAG0099858.1 hypothetical protein BGZ93_005617 [Podila epicladia]
MVSLRLFSIAAVAAYASTCAADVWSSNPVADTHWVIGSSAEIRWRLSSPTAKEHTATIFLVGGDHTAYTRLETLAKSVVLGSHKLTILKVPNVSCGSSCALEFLLDGDATVRDFYSHNFTISATGVATASATSGIVADKSAPVPVSGGMTPNGATPNGPITLVQNAAKGAQSATQTSAAQLNTPALVATIAASLVASALSMTWVL